jgi:RNA polymerase sigma-70 factor, ECF subfamily
MISAETPASLEAPPISFDTDRLYREYAPAVRRWAGKLTRHQAEVEDIVQEVFLVAHRRLPDIPALRHPAPWLFRITANVVRHRWREQRRRGDLRRLQLAEEPEARPSPLEDLERRQKMDRLSTALDALDAADRQLLWLCDVRCLPTSRVTAMTGIKPQTLRVRRFRARLVMARLVRDRDQGRSETDDARAPVHAAHAAHAPARRRVGAKGTEGTTGTGRTMVAQ